MTPISIKVPHAWQHVRLLRQTVGEALQGEEAAVRSAAMMTASELAENAIKYAEDVPGVTEIAFTMSVEASDVVIRVTNGTKNMAGVRELAERIDEVTRAPDKAALYIARLEQLLEDPSQSGKLGIYRIAFEGGFGLRCEYSDGTVTVTARRARR